MDRNGAGCLMGSSLSPAFHPVIMSNVLLLFFFNVTPYPDSIHFRASSGPTMAHRAQFWQWQAGFSVRCGLMSVGHILPIYDKPILVWDVFITNDATYE